MEDGNKQNTIFVGIGGIAYAERGRLSCLAVGSCIALGLIHVHTGQAAMAHIFLPEAPHGFCGGSSGKYADTAIEEMIHRLCAGRMPHSELLAYAAGGARMFPKGFGEDGMDVGRINSDAVLQRLTALQIPVMLADVGGTAARSVYLDIQAQRMTVFTDKKRVTAQG